eukprot:14554020-Ditylum_brightwellii.AAC.2
MAERELNVLPKVIKHLVDNGIGVVGTSRVRRGLPPYELQKIQQKDNDFNDFRYLVDDNGTLIARWMNNDLVLLVSTLHSVGNSIQVERKRPHITHKNSRQHVDKNWGNSHKKIIVIPLLVHHYNQ